MVNASFALVSVVVFPVFRRVSTSYSAYIWYHSVRRHLVIREVEIIVLIISSIFGSRRFFNFLDRVSICACALRE